MLVDSLSAHDSVDENHWKCRFITCWGWCAAVLECSCDALQARVFMAVAGIIRMFRLFSGIKLFILWIGARALLNIVMGTDVALSVLCAPGLRPRFYSSLMLDNLTEFSYVCVYYIRSCHGCLAEHRHTHTHNLSAKSVLPILLCSCTTVIRKALYKYKPFIICTCRTTCSSVCEWLKLLLGSWTVTPHIMSLFCLVL